MLNTLRRIDTRLIVAAGMLGLLAIVAIITAPQVTTGPPAYLSTAYHAEGYRAWATLLEREGVKVTRFNLRPVELDDHIETLISAQPPDLEGADARRTQADFGYLAAWVRRGGRLVYAGNAMHLGSAEGSLLELPTHVAVARAHGALSGPLAAPVVALAEVGEDRLWLGGHARDTSPRAHAARGREVELADRSGVLVVSYRLGRGEVVAVAGPGLFTNANLGRSGNARLAFLLGRPRHLGAVVAFDDAIHGALLERPWYRALPISIRVTLGIAGVALVLAALGAMWGGPTPMPLIEAREPDSGEFLAALAALYERHGARSTAASILVKDALATAARRAGLADDATPEAIAQRVPTAQGTAAIRELAAFQTRPPTSDTDLLAQARLAHRVWKDTSHGANRDRRRAAFTGGARTSRRR